MELFKALTVLESCREIARHMIIPRRSKTVPLRDSLGYRLFEDTLSADDVPGFNRSTMDGFAVRARDTFGASESLPAYLDIAGEVFMGKDVFGAAGPGKAWRIPTGGMLPQGCDAVVMVEYTEELDQRTIGVTRPVAPGENIVRRGEDISTGELTVARGRVIRPQEMGALAAAGITSVKVEDPLSIAIISTGDEVVDAEKTPGPGQVRDINSYSLFGMAARVGAAPRLCGIIGDDYRRLKEAMESVITESDVIILSGGSSVGTRDVSARVIESLGNPGILFHGISVKPGKPTIGAVVAGKPVFGLPGHPVSAMVVFILMVEPLIRLGRYPDSEDEFLKDFPVTAAITRNLRSAAGREDFVRVSLRHQDGKVLADPVLGKSGLIATMANADGLARIPHSLEGIEAGDMVRIKLI
ncbi:MAG: molybdenum cofactor biosynthesis protein [Peptococcaceae bacterium BRH_c4a]|nr:MAG: molybdenum cofactor biosynthesis protein [Peptococcaceae bacterium BRH_c4a]